MNSVLIALGANLGKPLEAFSSALASLHHEIGEVVAVSGVWQSPAWPPESRAPDYLNAVARVETELGAIEVLRALMDIEAGHGRVRSERNAPRTLDLDLIDHGGRMMESAELTLPHPRARERAFVLLPLEEVVPAWRHPLTGEGVPEMLGQLPSREVLVMRYLGRRLALPGDSH